jgi:hypothetical protein
VFRPTPARQKWIVSSVCLVTNFVQGGAICPPAVLDYVVPSRSGDVLWQGCRFILVKLGQLWQSMGRQESYVLYLYIMASPGSPRHLLNSFCSSLNFIFAFQFHVSWMTWVLTTTLASQEGHSKRETESHTVDLSHTACSRKWPKLNFRLLVGDVNFKTLRSSIWEQHYFSSFVMIFFFCFVLCCFIFIIYFCQKNN